MVALSNLEKSILFHLSLKGRSTVTELGKKLSVSKQRISYLMRKLEQIGVIKRYYAITNIYTLGKAHYRIFIKLGQIGFRQEEELREFLMNHTGLAWVVYLDGDFDILLVSWANNIIDFEGMYNDIMGKFGQYFQEKYFSIATRIEYLPFSFLCPPQKAYAESLVFGSHFSRFQLNPLDKRILNILNRRGRGHMVQISQELGIAVGTLKKRIMAMEEAGVIIGYHVKIDHALLGFVYQKVLLKLNDTSALPLERLTSFLKRKKSVIYLLKTIGNYDFEFELMSSSNAETFAIIKELRLTFPDNIRSHNLVVFKEEIKSEDLRL